MTNLRLFRSSLGLKQSELASQIGITQVYVSQIESGARPLTDELRYKLEEVYGEGCLDKFECESILTPTETKAEETETYKNGKNQADNALIVSMKETIEVLKDTIAKQEKIIENLQNTNSRLLDSILNNGR